MSALVAVSLGVCVTSVFATLSIWLGYPLLMRLLAVVHTHRALPGIASTMELPRVTVVLATREDPTAVSSRVANLFDTAHPLDRLRVIVAVDASREASDYAFDDPRVSVVAGDADGGKGASLNAGVRVADGDILVFADTAQRFVPETIPALTAPFARPDVGAVTGWLELPSTVPRAVDWYWRMERALRRDEAILHSSIGVTGAVWAMRRSLWAPLPPGVILDDVYSPMRLVLDGHRIAVSERAIALEGRAPDRSGEYRRKTRTLTGVFQVCGLLPALLRRRANPVWWQFVTHKLLRLATPFLVAVGVVSGGIVAAALAVSAFGARALLALPLLAVALAVVPPARRLGMQIWDAFVLQFAAVRAARNAWRGDWNVWH